VKQCLLAFHNRMVELPAAVPLMIKAAAIAEREPFRVVIAGDVEKGRALLRAAHSVYQPHRVILSTAGPVEPMAKQMKAPEGQPAAAFICTGQMCKPPTTEAAKVKEYLAEPPRK
jgi:uncharacterized protein YyaL (SSP411 family)